jgi:hypothetical protein
VVWRLPRYGTIHNSSPTPSMQARMPLVGRRRAPRWWGSTSSRCTGTSESARIGRRSFGSITPGTSPGPRTSAHRHENARMQGRMTRGPARRGPSLLAGLLRCARCGRKLHVTYTCTDGKVPRYARLGGSINHGTAKCIAFGGRAAAVAIEREALAVVEPVSSGSGPRYARRASVMPVAPP